MRVIDVVTLLILIIGGLNWGFVAIADFDVVTMIFGDAGVPGGASAASRVMYGIIALSALWQIRVLAQMLRPTED